MLNMSSLKPLEMYLYPLFHNEAIDELDSDSAPSRTAQPTIAVPSVTIWSFDRLKPLEMYNTPLRRDSDIVRVVGGHSRVKLTYYTVVVWLFDHLKPLEMYQIPLRLGRVSHVDRPTSSNDFDTGSRSRRDERFSCVYRLHYVRTSSALPRSRSAQP
ncbi:hypothetical protein PsYK624_171190 [Phanerochaete sordida]|uniref:Uncharacterized protein n=1 Tax=Phanerochaete sordida TaxID=48140 RepID=A0A9P3GS08_9APHY|nr:hypothetical protein PsYK624_171190 [Phanerochaete sordida]